MSLVYLPLTIGFYLLAQQLQKRINTPLLNPVLVTLLALVALLLFAGIEYEAYNRFSGILTDLLKPAVVALGVPLYQQLHSIKRELPQILLTVFVSVIVAVASTTAVALVLGASTEIAASLSPKSVTTPIAVLISEQVNGQPSITAIAVIVTGLVGSVIGVPWLKAMKITDPKAQGIAMGTACHALGTARIVEEGATQGAYSALSLVLSAIFSALVCPVVVPLISALF
ncbi:LrgB family protein [Reinekea marinisedimentorum]|uniref:Putative murein hydrolase (TIGR00659 family) n=1 Tax=Reinekea marinisedimentorum TaxID=230495 RepID=A0A4R3IAU4_9GAMM|nr:LrgB family protein [Reinekea marinisedimentorum]TCS43709.1 putative murein hydrolase (TIGR00659 family) [Reinekea marinisedimentorum]